MFVKVISSKSILELREGGEMQMQQMLDAAFTQRIDEPVHSLIRKVKI